MDRTYEDARWREHSTFSDAHQRLRRDSDAFSAGAQHALDRLLNTVSNLITTIDPTLADFVDSRAAVILDDIHHGRIA